jgi:hypothetical protein
MQYLDRKYFSLAGEMKVKSEFKYTIAFIVQRIYYSQLSYQTILILREQWACTVQWQNLKTHVRNRFLELTYVFCVSAKTLDEVKKIIHFSSLLSIWGSFAKNLNLLA